MRLSYIGVIQQNKLLSYYGTATALSQARRNLIGTSIGNYALFAGGYGTAASGVVDVYQFV